MAARAGPCLRAEGMSMAMMRPLAYLMMLPDRVSQRTLAHAMNTDSSALVRVLDLLEGEGWLNAIPTTRTAAPRVWS